MNSSALLSVLSTLRDHINQDAESSSIIYVSLLVVKLSFTLDGLGSGGSLLIQAVLAGVVEIVLQVRRA